MCAALALTQHVICKVTSNKSYQVNVVSENVLLQYNFKCTFIRLTMHLLMKWR